MTDLNFINPINGRYYHLSLHKDLLGDWILSRYRGGRQKHLIIRKHVKDFEETAREISRFIKIRLRRNYAMLLRYT